MTEIPKTPLVALAAFLGGAAVGAVVGAKLIERKLSLEFEQRLETETNAVRSFYGAIQKKEHPSPPDRLLSTQQADLYAAAINEERAQKGKNPVAYHKITPAEEDVTETVKQYDEVRTKTMNVFDGEKERPAEIYQITEKEFTDGESNYLQPTLTWYAGDGVLTDEHEEPMEDFEKTVGKFTDADFGRQSSDENTLHVRNEILQLEFEIVRHEGKFSEVVLGEEAPVQRPRDRIRGG